MTRRTFAHALLTGIFSTFLILLSVHGVHAATGDPGSISGDTLCGSSVGTKCGPEHIRTIAGKVFKLIAYVGTALLVVALAWRFLAAVFAYMRGDSGALARAKNQAFSSLIGFLIIVMVFGGGYLALLKAFGVQDAFLQLVKLFSEAFIPHAYASELPNPLASKSAYDILMSALSLIIRFFIYPALIALWVASGFKFVMSQGNPEGLKTARGWLFYTVIVTVIVLSLQGFVAALRATADRVTGTTTTN